MDIENVSPSIYITDVYKRIKRRGDGNQMYKAKRRCDIVHWKKVSVKHRHKFERLVQVWKNDPQSVTVINGNGVCFEEEFLIGSSSCGTAVYICLGLDGIERAIKRVPKHLYLKLLTERDILNFPKASKSPHIVNYWYSDDDSSDDTCYLILDLYEQNLQDYVKEEGEAITESRAREMIRQVLEGLRAIHGSKPIILHRDLKPSNVLIDVEGNLALSDFGIGRILSDEDATTYYTNSAEISGSVGWMAYESTNWSKWFPQSQVPSDSPIAEPKWKRQSDIQAAGMLAFYIHTKGEHPFGEAIIDRMTNLREGNAVGLAKLNGDSDVMVKDLLSQMLARELDKRPYVEQALKHPYFLSCEEQMKFVAAVGNEPKLMNYNGVTRQLNNIDPLKPRSPLLPNDWKTVIGHDDLDTLCRGGHRFPSEYDGSRYTDCLRLIRNACQHRDGKLRQLKKVATSSLEKYFFQLFPALPLVLLQIIREDPNWKTLPALEEFFP
ncbi:serine threonine- kinase endoribonuclease IRE1 [Paramuricea clavata]|uniref:Serine threonine- kinase endoribonuclease IRE1 n=1 Tax=Paramuricea clavata TaxID=317549 RepID=A0A6S7JGA2_PARCT|nr:serine threonine- kinase endoribonuclease IRE1 [Paramuricea clavata]